GPQTLLTRMGIGPHQRKDIALAGDDDQRMISRFLPSPDRRAPQPVGRDEGQEQRQIAPGGVQIQGFHGSIPSASARRTARFAGAAGGRKTPPVRRGRRDRRTGPPPPASGLRRRWARARPWPAGATPLSRSPPPRAKTGGWR